MPRFKVTFPNYYIVEATDDNEALDLALQLWNLFSLNEIPVAHNDSPSVDRLEEISEVTTDNHYLEEGFNKWKEESNVPVSWIADKIEKERLFKVFQMWLVHPTLEEGEYFEIPTTEEPAIYLREPTSEELDDIVVDMLNESPARTWTRDAVADYCFKQKIVYSYGKFLYTRIRKKLLESEKSNEK